MRLAKIAVEAATYAIDKPYTYLVPEDMTLSVGCRVLVPFGRGNRVSEGMVLEGPLPADTAFLPARLRGYDAVLAMYHDQGLPVLKFSGFEQAVNITLGLPYPRVAVDHGTALDLAGKGSADPSSLIAAMATCARMARARSAIMAR